jgi:hypothetical protein
MPAMVFCAVPHALTDGGGRPVVTLTNINCPFLTCNIKMM